MVAPRSAVDTWESLDVDTEPEVVWPRSVDGPNVVLLLGAFDPPTNAHLDIARAASRLVGSPAALCMTKVLLARTGETLLDTSQRIAVLLAIADRCGLGLAFANRGTYLDVGRAVRASGVEPTFVIGSDKLSQLSDPSFYENGEAGVRSTFDELRFVVIPRDGSPVEERADVQVLDLSDVFRNDSHREISGTEVRRRFLEGSPVDDLVPPEVAAALEGYTQA